MRDRSALEAGVRMKRALPLLLALAGCSLRDPRVSSVSCTANSQCSSANVCFLGECRAPAANLSIVRVEVRPPSGSQFGLKDEQRDLRQSILSEFILAVPLSATGTVTQNGAPMVGATVVFSDHDPAIPDRVAQIVAQTDTSGAYRASIPQGLWDVLLLASPLPPLHTGPIDTATPALNFTVPAPTALPELKGTLKSNGTAVAGVRITAVDPQGNPISAPVVSQVDGTYSLLLPPAPTGQVVLQIAPPDAGSAQAASLDPFPIYASVPYQPTIDLQLPDIATVSGRVLDVSGKPLPAVLVYVRSLAMPWSLSRTVTANANGAFSVQVRVGNYLVEAVPPTDAASLALSGQQLVTFPGNGAADLVCPPKVRRYGKVLTPDGRAASADFQVVATRLSDGLLTTRSAPTVSTDSLGVFNLTLDAGRWRFEVAPPSNSPWPRKIVQIDVDGSDVGPSALPDIVLSTPLTVGGVVKGSAPGGAQPKVADALVSFYALDASGHSVFLGSGLTDTNGQYSAVLPDVAQPGASP
jgi:hypothetical protein